MKTHAETQRDEFQRGTDSQRAAPLSKATEEAQANVSGVFDEARQAADALSATRQDALRRQGHHLNQAITRRTQQEVFAIARKALTELAATSLEARMAEVFIRRVRELDDQTKHGLATALSTASAPAIVRSACEMPAEQRSTIQHALNDAFSADIPLRFETAPDLVSGIELTANGHKVAWSIADYLTSLEKGVGELLDTPVASEPAPEIDTDPQGVRQRQ